MNQQYKVYYTPAVTVTTANNPINSSPAQTKTRQVFFKSYQQLNSNNKRNSSAQMMVNPSAGQRIGSSGQSIIQAVQEQINKSEYINNAGGNSISIIHSNLSNGSNKQGSGIRTYSKLEERIRSRYQQNVNSNLPQQGLAQTNPNFIGYQNQNQARPDYRYFQTVDYKNYQDQYGLQGTNRNKLLSFPDQNANDKYHASKDNSNRSHSRNKVQPQQRILIQTTLLKPKFGFKTADNSKNLDKDSIYHQDDLISFETSQLDGMDKMNSNSLNQSKSASNFSDILRIQENKISKRLAKNGQVEGYVLSKIDKKQDKINKKLQQIRKNNEQYEKKIREKQREIEMVRKRMEKQQRQMHNYQSKIVQAYDNVNQNADSLLLSSRNYETSNPKMQARVNGKIKVGCNFLGMNKKLCKQIIYGKYMIFQSDLLQIGFDNKAQPRVMQLYFTVKQSLMEMNISVQNSIQNGFKINDQDLFMLIRNIPSGKKIKAKIKVQYLGTSKDQIGLMSLKIAMKINPNSIFTEIAVLPFSLYRNFITEVNQNLNQNKQRKNRNINNQPLYALSSKENNYPMVTQWQNSNDEFMKNPKGYLEVLFKNGYWIDENIYHVDLLFRDFQRKSINILINCRNFAIEMVDTKNIELVLSVGNFLAKPK